MICFFNNNETQRLKKPSSHWCKAGGMLNRSCYLKHNQSWFDLEITTAWMTTFKYQISFRCIDPNDVGWLLLTMHNTYWPKRRLPKPLFKQLAGKLNRQPWQNMFCAMVCKNSRFCRLDCVVRPNLGVKGKTKKYNHIYTYMGSPPHELPRVVLYGKTQ